MMGRELLTLLEAALEHSPANQTEVGIQRVKRQLTRFANSEIHQNVAEEHSYFSVRVLREGRMGSARADCIEHDAILAAVDRACDLSRLSPPLEFPYRFPSSPPPTEVEGFDPAVAVMAPGARARGVEEIRKETDRAGVAAFGAISASTVERAAMNTSGIRVYAPSTSIEASVSTIGSGGYGYAAAASRRLGDLNMVALARESTDKCLGSQDAVPVEAGRYDVVLDEYAVADVLSFLSWLVFNGEAFEEGRSYLSGRLGEKLFPKTINIWDDATDPAGMAVPFDGEGVAKRRVDLIQDGVAKAVVYDSMVGQRYGTASTGHGSGYSMWNPGPVARNLFLGRGQATKDEMIAGTERGIYVTRFHYTRVVEPKTAAVTGMTRDGTFLIEKGKITRPIMNLRFTQSYVEALKNLDMLGREAKIVASGGGAAVVPPVRIKDFTFTGTTEY